MASTYATIPADVESEATLINKPKTSFKTLVGGAAAAAFILGALAGTVIQPTATRVNPSFAADSSTDTPSVAHLVKRMDGIEPATPSDWTSAARTASSRTRTLRATCPRTPTRRRRQ